MNKINDTKDWMHQTIVMTTRDRNNKFKGTVEGITFCNGKELKLKVKSVKIFLHEEWRIRTKSLEISFDLNTVGDDGSTVYLNNGKILAKINLPHIGDRTLKNNKSGSFFIIIKI